MTDNDRKRWIQKARIKIKLMTEIITLYKKKLSEKEAENEKLRNQLTLLEARNSARLDEMECDAYNL